MQTRWVSPFRPSIWSPSDRSHLTKPSSRKSLRNTSSPRGSRWIVAPQPTSPRPRSGATHRTIRRTSGFATVATKTLLGNARNPYPESNLQQLSSSPYPTSARYSASVSKSTCKCLPFKTQWRVNTRMVASRDLPLTLVVSPPPWRTWARLANHHRLRTLWSRCASMPKRAMLRSYRTSCSSRLTIYPRLTETIRLIWR